MIGTATIITTIVLYNYSSIQLSSTSKEYQVVNLAELIIKKCINTYTWFYYRKHEHERIFHIQYISNYPRLLYVIYNIDCWAFKYTLRHSSVRMYNILVYLHLLMCIPSTHTHIHVKITIIIIINTNTHMKVCMIVCMCKVESITLLN